MNKIILFKNPFLVFKKRNVVFDLLKLFAALLVIMDHTLQRWIDGSQTTQFYNFIFLTQMPLFMFVAGFFAARKVDRINSFRAFAASIVKVALSLLIPFVSYSLIANAIDSPTFTVYLEGIVNSFLYPSTSISLWFLWALFWLESFFISSIYLSKLFRCKSKWIRLLVLVAIFLFVIAILAVLYLKITSFFDIKLIVFYSVFFSFGVGVFLLKNTKPFSIRYKVWFKPIFGSACLIALIVVMMLRPNIISDDETLVNIAIRIIGSISSICLCYCVFYYVAKVGFIDNISVIGSLSLEIYYTHLLILSIPLLKDKLSYPLVTNILIYICLYLVVISITLVSIMLLKSFAITDFVLYGKADFIKRNNQTE